jgi:hypothetical protein
MHFLLLTIAIATPTPLADIPASLSSNVQPRQNTGCYCGSRKSSGLSLSGDCANNELYNCTEQYDSAEVQMSCLICSSMGGMAVILVCWDCRAVGPIGLGKKE